MRRTAISRSGALITLVLLLCALTFSALASTAPVTPPQPAPCYGVVELSGISQNAHTIPFLMWVANDGKDVYFAVKSTHDLGEVIIGAAGNSASTQILTRYGAGVPIVLSNKPYDPAAGLSGNTKDAHWTLAWFDGPTTTKNILLKADANGELLFSIEVQGAPGHSLVNQTYTLTPYKGNVSANKIWSGGPLPRATVYFQLWRTFEPITGDTNPVPAPVPVPNLAARALPYGVTTTTWENIDITDIYGRRYAFSVVEGSMVNGVFVAGGPGNYDKLESGLNVTNTWLTRSVSVGKVWLPAGVAPPAGAEIEYTLTRGATVNGVTVPDTQFSSVIRRSAARDGSMSGMICPSGTPTTTPTPTR